MSDMLSTPQCSCGYHNCFSNIQTAHAVLLQMCSYGQLHVINIKPAKFLQGAYFKI